MSRLSKTFLPTDLFCFSFSFLFVDINIKKISRLFVNHLFIITTLVLFGFALIGCETFQARKKIQHQLTAESYFYHARFDTALDQYRALTKNSKNNSRLLYLLEAGTLMHVAGSYEKSNLAFLEADELVEKLKKNIGKEIGAFFLSDVEQNFIGESFERVLIKMYIALNYLMLGDEQKAFNYFRKMNYELQEMKYEEASYRQDNGARYLYALLAESLGEYNKARVQYNNMILLGDEFAKSLAKDSLKKLEAKEKGEKKITGSLIVIVESGKAAVKESRGKLKNDPVFMQFLEGAIISAIAVQNASLAPALVLNGMKNAENPVPYYKVRSPQSDTPQAKITINNKFTTQTDILSSYSLTAIKNYNEQYNNIVQKNVASLATKAVTAMIAAEISSALIAEQAGDNPYKELIRVVASVSLSAGLGAIAAETIQPDLRCWRINFDNLQIKRLHLEKGEYQVMIDNPYDYPGKVVKTVEINPGKNTYILMRNF